uniref:nucleotidyltransferase domain-containing protein n=1 Tax=Ensifer adhaerens TaxID=106592 RepID=UPI003F496550
MTRPIAQSALRFPMTSIFGTEANVRVMRELARHGGQLSATDLMIRASVTYPSVTKALNALTEFSVVTEAGSRRSRVYSLDIESPFHSAISHLFEAEEIRFDESIRAVKECAESFGTDVFAAWIYGSVARSEDKAGSDFDIMFVATEAAVSSIQERAVDFLSDKGKKLKFWPSVGVLSPTDLERLAKSNDPLWNDLVHQALVIVGPRPNRILHSLQKNNDGKKRLN